MAAYLAALAMLAIYIAAIPVKCAAILQISAGLRFGAGLALFEPRFAYRRAMRRAAGIRPHLPWKKLEMDAKKLALFHALRRGGGYMLRHVRIEQVYLRGSLGLSDAARTALVCGTANAVGAGLRPVLRPGVLSIDLQPEFSGGGCAELGGMISLRMGHIMIAAMMIFFEYADRRLKLWISTRSKTS